MAINKRKVLDAARKFAQKGAKQKALKEYNKLIQVDPRDAKLLLEVGDAYRRWGQVEEAIAQYNKVANQYKQDGFDARAVAVLKQILNLDPKYHAAHVSLAELYQRMGLESDAIASLQTAADTCYKEGRRKEALELLRKMAALDPSNTTSRLKVADLLKQEGLDKEAVAEYQAVADELGRQGATEQVVVVQERILEIQPERSDLLIGLARALCDLGRPERAEPFALRAIEKAPEPDTYELLCGVYKALNNDVRLAEVTRDLASAYRESGDEDRAREVMQRLPSEAVMPAADHGGDRSEVDESLLSDDELLEDDDFLVTDDEFTLEDELVTSETEAPAPGAASGAESVTEAAEEVALPEGDPDQLFAEASVYLRYGKRDQAIANLKAILLQEPEHRAALEKLGEAYAETGEEDQAIACWRRAAEAARAEGEAAAFGILRDRIGALDPAAAEGLEQMVEADAGDPVGKDESEFELELELEEPSEDSDDSIAESADSEAELDIDVDGDDAFSFDLDTEQDLASEPEDDGSDVEVEVGSEDDETDDEGFELDIDLSEELSADPSVDAAAELDIPVELEDGPTASTSEGAGQSTMTAAQVQEDLEEADFYIQQGLSDEAEAIYRRILAVAPNHPSALLKLGELAAARGEDPGEVSNSGLDAPAPELADEGIDVDVSDEADIEVDVGVDADDSSRAAEDDGDEQIEIDVTHEPENDLGEDETDGIDLGGADEAADEGEGFDVAEEFGLDLSEDEGAELSFDDDDDEASIDLGAESESPTAGGAEEVGEDSTQVEQVASPVDPSPPFETEPLVTADHADTESVTQSDATQPYAPPTEEPTDAPEPLAAASDDEASFDLGEALADVFDDDAGAAAAAEDPNETSAVLSTVEDGFESIFADFKKGVSATLGEGDHETRFDLGIAYREMGLYDDAIGEFRVCLGSDDHRFQSLSMMGLCAFDLGRFPDAINHFEQALASEGLAPEQQAGVNFDLGRAHVSSGDAERARAAFDRVKELDPSFPGVNDQLDALASGGAEAALELEDESDEWESFDDIMGDDDADDVVDAEPEQEGETFESFDDVITEAEAIVEAEPIEEDAGADQLDVAVEPEPAAPEDTPSPRPARKKKKKISFV